MIRILLVLILLNFAALPAVFAQTATPQPLNVTERCITAPTEPPDDWTFDGTIITWGNGLHGFRADFPSRYYLAFSSEDARFGALSPDGQWFASYVGREEATYSMMFNSRFIVTHIQVVSTLPTRETYLIPFDNYQYIRDVNFSPVIWLDNTRFVAHNYWDEWFTVNPFVETISEASEEEIKEAETLTPLAESVGYRRIRSINPDNPPEGELPRAFLARNPDVRSGRLYITDLESQRVYDTCIDTTDLMYNFALSPDGDQVAVSIGSENGFVYIVDLNEWKAYRLNLAANNVVAWIADQ